MSEKKYLKYGLFVLAMSIVVTFTHSSSAALVSYNQDFEAMTPNQGWPPNDLSADGWQVYGFEWDANPYNSPANIVNQYGPFPAANGEPGSFQGVATDQGGPDQGNVVLAKYSDYNNTNQATLYIQGDTFQQQTIGPGDVGLWRFSYDAKIGNLEADSSAFAYLQTFDPVLFYQKSIVVNDSTHLPIEWGTYSIDLLIDGSMVGDILTFGFSATATNSNGSGVFYDNLRFDRVVVPVPAAFWLFGSGLVGLIGVARRKKV